jgi:hypothetical protein
VKEVIPGKPAFRWSGPSAELLVPGLEGPPAAFLTGERTGPATRLTVKDLASGQTLVERVVEPGPFELAILPAQTQGPLPDVSRYAISCDTPLPLPPFPGGLRPEQGCFVFREATLSLPRALWERQGRRRIADLGGLEDRRAAPAGFHAREEAGTTGTSLRWTTGEASVLFVPETASFPRCSRSGPVPVRRGRDREGVDRRTRRRYARVSARRVRRGAPRDSGRRR